MISSALERFIYQAASRSRKQTEPAEWRVLALAPLMLDRIEQAGTFLEPQHYRSDPHGYTRNLVYDAADESLSLYSIVWLPGQWTPVHDHGSWGVVGVIEGVLEQRSYVRLSPDRGAEQTSTWCARWAPARSARRRHELRSKPRSHSRHRGSIGAASGSQPAPLRTHDERLQHLRRWCTDTPATSTLPTTRVERCWMTQLLKACMKTWLRQNLGFLRIVLAFLRLLSRPWRTGIPSRPDRVRPTLLEGDVVLVDRLAYDVKVPLTDIVLLPLADPRAVMWSHLRRP